jgi:hypothetical protein
MGYDIIKPCRIDTDVYQLVRKGYQMIDYLYIGAVPTDEDCAQVGEANYAERARAECKRFAKQIQRHYPEPENGWLQVKSNPHDFGTYYEVIACYDPSDADSANWAFDVENDVKNVLMVWDDHFKQ